MAKTLEKTLKAIKPLDARAMASARERQDNLTKPLGSLGRLEELSVQIAGITGKPLPKIEQKAIITMAADHGVTAEGISLYPAEVTPQMVLNFLNGGAAINVLTGVIGARVVIVDMGVKGNLPKLPGLISKPLGAGTENMAKGPAMTEKQALTAIETGIAIAQAEIDKELDIIGTGDMGIGNTTAASAIFAAASGLPAAKTTGKGTGLDDKQLKHKVEVIEKALNINKPDPKDALDILTKVGGFEIGGLTGVILAGAANKIPVVIDGFISGAAMLIAVGLEPRVKDYVIAAHLSAEAGHKALLEFLGLKPLISLDMRLGEGTGAALGMMIAQSAVKILSDMATFAEAGVSEAEEK